MTAPAADPLPSEHVAALADFARACKGAARAVSLYPRTHPSIRTALDRLATAAGRLIQGPSVTLVVHPDTLVIDGRSLPRPESSISEFAALLHARMVGELTIEREADADDWHALLLIVGTSPDDLLAGGGFAKGWAASGRAHFAVREIDYAEVLRERNGGRQADWDHIIASCLVDGSSLDEHALTTLLQILGDPDQLSGFIEHLQTAGPGTGLAMGTRATALLQVLRAAMDAVSARGDEPSWVLQAAADAAPRFNPDLIVGVVKERVQAPPELATVADGLLTRITDNSIAGLVANSVAAERGATERLAQAFEALVPDDGRKAGLLEMAQEVARRAAPDGDAAFESLWQGAKQMLLSYSDTNYVSAEYARELTSARQQAVEVERVSDDPPERVTAWLASVSEESIRLHDLALLCDLLRIESDPAKWAALVNVVVPEIERHTLLGNADGARHLAELIAVELSDKGRWDFSIEAGKAMERLATGPLVRHVITHLRKAEETEAICLTRLCHVIGAALVRPLAEALAVEENSRSIRRLRDLLLGFGAAGRHGVEQLKASSNPAVRRTAIDLLRMFGGSDALRELSSLLGDSDPQVQRESIRAIVQIATPDAYGVLQRALANDVAARETILRELIDLRDHRAVPILCFALDETPRRKLVELHAAVVEALGGLNATEESLQTLRRVLYAGTWWAPLRTAAMRKAAAAALRRLNSTEATAVLQEAAAKGSRGVRAVARVEAQTAARRERV